MSNKICLKEGIKVISENGDVYEVEEGDYVVINNQIRQGPILNTDILKSIDNDDKLEAILDVIEVHSEHYIINQLITGMNIELEHTDDIYIALNIAVDHVIEIPDYYTRLIDMERKALGENVIKESFDFDVSSKEIHELRELLNDVLRKFVGKTEPQMISLFETIYDRLAKALDISFVDLLTSYLSELELIKSNKDFFSKLENILLHNERKYGTEPRAAIAAAIGELNIIKRKL